MNHVLNAFRFSVKITNQTKVYLVISHFNFIWTVNETLVGESGVNETSFIFAPLAS